MKTIGISSIRSKGGLGFAAAILWLTLPNLTSAAADLWQGRNGSALTPHDPVEWARANAGPATAHFTEGNSIPYRFAASNLPLGSHRLLIEWETKRSGRRAIDYVTSFNRLIPHDIFATHSNPEQIDPLADLAGPFSAPGTFPVPLPTPLPTGFTSLPEAERVFSIWNGTITAISYLPHEESDDDRITTRLAIDFQAAAPSVVIAWGGHIASRSDWGDGNTAAGINGSPYHMRLVALDGEGDEQDRSLQASAVVAPPLCQISGPASVVDSTTNSYAIAAAGANADTLYSWALINNTAGALLVGPSDGPTVLVSSGPGGYYQLAVNVTIGTSMTGCSIDVIVLDLTPPTLICPGDIVAEASGAFGTVVDYAPADAFDLVDGAVAVTCAPASGTYIALGTTPVSCTATDKAGNRATCSFVVTVLDTTPPVVTCPSDVLQEATSAVGAVVNYAPASALDVVDGSMAVTCVPAAGTSFALGTTPVSCAATDKAGNRATCSFVVTVLDTTPPVVTCPSDVLQEATSAAGAVVNYAPASALDVVDGSMAVTCVPAAGTSFALGTTPVSCTATDKAGNRATCSFVVTVLDTTPPVVTCPSDVLQEATSAAGAVVNYAPASALDVVDGSMAVTCVPAAGTSFALGTTPVSCTATDKAGNRATCSFVVTVLDTTPPVVTCPSDVLQEATSAAGAVVNYAPASALDVVDGSMAVTCVPAAGTSFALGTTPVSCAATDKAGNRATCSFVVTVLDTTPPVVTCPSDVLQEATSAAGAVVNYAPASALDVVDGSMAVTCVPAAGTSFALGTTPVSCTATDKAGNRATCSFVVTVLDTTPPVVTCPADVLQEATSAAGAVVNYAPASALDVVDGSMAVTCVPAAGTSFALGTTPVSCAATDKAGNRATCSFAVTVLDTTPPVVTCPADVLQEATSAAGAVVNYAPASALDVVDGSMAVTCVPAAGTSFALGTTPVSCAATDKAGNQATCSFVVTVLDTTPPVVTCPADVLQEATSAAGAVVNYAPASALDVVDGSMAVTCVPAAGTSFALGTTPVSCAATDKAGNQATCSFVVTVLDTTPPQITCPADFTVNEDVPGLGSARLAYPLPETADAADLQPSVRCLPPPDSIVTTGLHAIVCTARDASGNENTCSFQIKVVPQQMAVDSAADSGPGSLRQALLDANAAPGPNVIVFAFTGIPPYTIQLLSPLPPITDSVFIDGWSQLEFQGTPVIQLAGNQAVGAAGGIPGAVGNLIDGLVLNSPSNTVRGLALNGFDVGIRIEGMGGNLLEGNFIGTDPTGTNALGNRGDGIRVNSGGNQIRGNRIAFNAGRGVAVLPLAGTGNAIRGNSIFLNGLLGIDLGIDGPTLNDPGDTDTGPNQWQNYPVLTPAQLDATTGLMVGGTLGAASNEVYEVDFFLNNTADPSGFGEGEIFLGTVAVQTDAAGMGVFLAIFPTNATPDQFVTATATDGAGNTSELSAAAAINSPPVVVVPPSPAAPAPGDPATLCVEAKGSPPFAYQWRHNGANIPDATNACYTIPSAEVSDGGSYTVVVGNNEGAVTSEAAPLLIQTPELPAGDNFADAVRLVTTNGLVSGTNTFATTEPKEPLHVGKPGGHSVWYVWNAPADGVATFSTAGSTFDTLLGVYTGTAVGNLSPVVTDEDRGGYYTSTLRFNTYAKRDYYIAIDGFGGVTGTYLFSWGVTVTNAFLPVITNQPISQTVAPDGTAVFVVGAEPGCVHSRLGCSRRGRGGNDDEHDDDPQTPILTYQWFLNGVAIPGATQPMLTVNNVNEVVLGDYMVRVFDGAVFADSVIASLQINLTGNFVQSVQAKDKFLDSADAPVVLRLGTPPSNGAGGGLVAASVVRGYTGTQVFSTAGSASEGEVICGVIGGSSEWISMVAEETGLLHVNTDGSSFDTVLAVYRRSPTNAARLELVGCDNNSGRDHLDSLLNVPVTIGQTNFIVIDGVNGAVGTLRLNYSLVTSSRVSTMGFTPQRAHRVRVTGHPDMRFSIQVSSNAVNWTSLVTTSAVTSFFDYTDLGSTNTPRRFYRSMMLP